VNDHLVGVNGISLQRFRFNESIELVKHAEWPLMLRFRRLPSSAATLFSNWGVNALRQVCSADRYAGASWCEAHGNGMNWNVTHGTLVDPMECDGM